MSDAKRRVVFISGPMTGKPDCNRDEFNVEAAALERAGFAVLNPATLPEGLEHHQYMAITLAMLDQADVIFLLEGWDNSKGAMLEYVRARTLGLMFLYQSWDVVSTAMGHNGMRAPIKGVATGVVAMRAFYSGCREAAIHSLSVDDASECADAMNYCNRFLKALGELEGQHDS